MSPHTDDEGSVLLLTLGYALLAIAAILVCVSATSMYLAQKHLDSVADAAALAGADGFSLVVDGDDVIAALDSAGVRRQAASIVDAIGAVGDDVVLVSASTPDGVSARVTVRATWHPSVLSLFVPDGVRLEATATSRTALR
jgi:uncharacterized membrane protein